MSKPKPLENPDYTEIFVNIFRGVNTPKKLIKKIYPNSPSSYAFKRNKSYRKVKVKYKGKEIEERSGPNFSMKLQNLVSKGFIKRARTWYQRGSESKYELDYLGILHFAQTLMIDELKNTTFEDDSGLNYRYIWVFNPKTILIKWLSDFINFYPIDETTSLQCLVNDFIIGLGEGADKLNIRQGNPPPCDFLNLCRLYYRFLIRERIYSRPDGNISEAILRLDRRKLKHKR